MTFTFKLAIFSALLGLAAPLCSVASIYEAEDARLTGKADARKDVEGYSGEGFAFIDARRWEGHVEFDVQAERAGPQKITIRYRTHPQVDADVIVTVNGQDLKQKFYTVHDWSTWAHLTLTVDLIKGKNEIVVGGNRQYGRGVYCIDYLAIGNVITEPCAAILTVEQQEKKIIEASERLQSENLNGLIMVMRHFIPSSHNYTYFNEGFYAGGGLYRLDKDGLSCMVDASEGEILDAELSYDAKQVLFSWRKKKSENYDLYLINTDGSNLRQITQHPGNDFNASWLPDGGILFLSDRDNNYAYCMHISSAVLYRMEQDGSKLTRLSANYLSDIAPHIMADGKILYCRWEYVDRFQIPCQGLWAQNPDGSSLTHVWGGRLLSPVTISEAKSIPDGSGRIIATLTGHNGAICGGIGVIDPTKGAHNFDAVTEVLGSMVRFEKQSHRGSDQRYEFPYPVDAKRFLVSNNGNIELSTFDGKKMVKLVDGDLGPAFGGLGWFAALPIQPRKREPIITSALQPDMEHGLAIMQDVYMGLEDQLADGSIKRGDIKEIRVVEGLGKSNKGHQNQRAFCWQFPVVSAGATMEPKKTVSIVKVEEDGSAMFEVPAMKPVFFQALDAEGRVIHRMRTFGQFMPGEVQSCTGCHMDRNTVTPMTSGQRIVALTKPIQKLTGPRWNEHPSAFSYPDQVQPIMDKHCVSCHNAKKQHAGVDLSGDRTDLFNVSYDNLARTGANRSPNKTGARPEEFLHTYVSYIPSYNGSEKEYMAHKYFLPYSWGSYKSKLADLVRNGHPNSKGKKRVNLSDMEKRIIYCWIDYNIPYYPTSFTNHPDLPHGMRELVPKDFDKTLRDVAERRCISCHSEPRKDMGWFNWAGNKKRVIPRDFYLRWEAPELNNFMLAPLAKEAGGTAKCGMAVFKDTNDPDYQLLLKAFDPIHERVDKIPRMDMPGAQEIRGDKHSILWCDQDIP